MANPTAINPNAIDAAAAIASNVQWPSPPVNSLSLIARWCCSRRDQHVSMDELQSHVMPYARPRAAVATQFNVVEVPGKSNLTVSTAGKSAQERSEWDDRFMRRVWLRLSSSSRAGADRVFGYCDR